MPEVRLEAGIVGRDDERRAGCLRLGAQQRQHRSQFASSSAEVGSSARISAG